MVAGSPSLLCQRSIATIGGSAYDTGMPSVAAYAVSSPTSPFTKTTIHRREPGPTEIYFQITHAGICHSDIHTARGEWGKVNYPLVPGHEIAGIVTNIGSQVTKFRPGDRVGVGCFVDSCRQCQQCRKGEEQHCQGRPGTIWTYDSIGRDGIPTAGGYSQGITVEQDYVCHIPAEIKLAQAAPLLCAGITLYAPLKRWGTGPGKRVAIVGMGGLGHMGVQIAAAMGARVAVISQTLAKQADGLRFGASEYYATSQVGTLASLRNSFDLIINTVSAAIDINALLKCLVVGGALVDVGLPAEPLPLDFRLLTSARRIFAGSLIGGISETQEMLTFCAQHGIAPQIEIISGSEITAAYDKVVASKARYRYVIDTATFGEASAH